MWSLSWSLHRSLFVLKRKFCKNACWTRSSCERRRDELFWRFQCWLLRSPDLLPGFSGRMFGRVLPWRCGYSWRSWTSFSFGRWNPSAAGTFHGRVGRRRFSSRWSCLVFQSRAIRPENVVTFDVTFFRVDTSAEVAGAPLHHEAGAWGPCELTLALWADSYWQNPISSVNGLLADTIPSEVATDRTYLPWSGVWVQLVCHR